MVTKKTKIIVGKHFLSSFKQAAAALGVEYVVEAKSGRRWVKVGGPFADETAANIFANEYSTDHPDTEVQVVIFQS
jgi:hypothetical protein